AENRVVKPLKHILLEPPVKMLVCNPERVLELVTPSVHDQCSVSFNGEIHINVNWLLCTNLKGDKTHKKKRAKQVKKLIHRGLLDTEKELLIVSKRILRASLEIHLAWRFVS
ncbi:hypothetical protein M8C21_005644, partial [Ambrosia artemisiifolia]